MDSSSEHPGSRAHHFNGFGNKEKRRTSLGHISSWILWKVSRGYCFVYMFHHIIFIVVCHALDTTYTLGGGGYPGSC
jgi:hypothetical protein